MLRALITAALLTGMVVRLLDAPADVVLAYTLGLCATLWLTWPALRYAARLARRARQRRKRRRLVPDAHAPAPHLTQINHHHHYYGAPPPQPAQRRGHSLPALPQRGRQQVAHDAVYRTIDIS